MDAASERPVVITTDTHIGGAHVDFGPYFDPSHRPLYEEQREMARRAAVVLAKRKANAAVNSTSGVSRDGLLDAMAMGDSPFEPELIAARQDARRAFLADIGVEAFNEDDFMSVAGESDPALRLRMLEADGTVASVIFPQLGFILGDVSDPDVKWAGIRAHNRWLADFVTHEPERWAGVFLLDLADIDRCCEEARWAREHGLRGGAFIQGGSPPGLPTFNQLYYEPLFSTLEDLELPFTMHAAFSGAGTTGGWRTGPGAALMNEMWTSSDALAKGGPLFYWIGGGVFERHPRLKVVVAETGGLWWAAEACTIIDRAYESGGRSAMRVLNRSRQARLKEFPRKPSEYFATNVYVQGHCEDVDWERIPEVGFDNVMWGSDFPHAEGSWPDSKEWLARQQAKFQYPRPQVDKFLGGNAARVYGFDLDVLRPLAQKVGPDLQPEPATVLGT